jgi:hypothetical protein
LGLLFAAPSILCNPLFHFLELLKQAGETEREREERAEGEGRSSRFPALPRERTTHKVLTCGKIRKEGGTKRQKTRKPARNEREGREKKNDREGS